jgi:hypothetical protein
LSRREGEVGGVSGLRLGAENADGCCHAEQVSSYDPKCQYRYHDMFAVGGLRRAPHPK